MAYAYDAILFDFDGVLVDSEPLHFACWRDVAATVGMRVEWPWYQQRAIGIADREMVALVCEVNGRPDLTEALWGLFGKKKRLFSERILQHLPMPASVREMLLQLDLPLALVSTSFRQEVEPALVAAGLRDRFQVLIFGDDVKNLKPHPEPYLTAAARLDAKHPLVVEDSETGAAAGLAAGFTVVRVTSANETAEGVRRALHVS